MIYKKNNNRFQNSTNSNETNHMTIDYTTMMQHLTREP